MKVIGVVSGKGGVGKTTTVANLGAALAGMGKRVLLIDGNMIAPNLSFHFGIYKYPKTLVDFIRGECSLRDAICSHPCGVDLLPTMASTQPIKGFEIKPELERTGYEYVLIDTAPGLEREVFPVTELSDEIIVIANPEYPSATDARRTVRLIEREGLKLRGIVLNRVGIKGELSATEIQYICEAFVICMIPERDEVRRCISSGQPVLLKYPRSPASLEFRLLASQVSGEKYVPSFMEKMSSILWLVRKRRAMKELAKAPPVPPREVTELERIEPVDERMRLERMRSGIVQAIESLEKQREKGLISEEIYDKLKRRNEEALRKIEEKLASL